MVALWPAKRKIFQINSTVFNAGIRSEAFKG